MTTADSDDAELRSLPGFEAMFEAYYDLAMRAKAAGFMRGETASSVLENGLDVSAQPAESQVLFLEAIALLQRWAEPHDAWFEQHDWDSDRFNVFLLRQINNRAESLGRLAGDARANESKLESILSTGHHKKLMSGIGCFCPECVSEARDAGEF